MVDETGLSSRLKRFIADHIDSVMQLELLLLLRERLAQAWSAEGLAQECRVEPIWVEGHLRAMVAAGLATAFDTMPATYRYAPKSPEMMDTVDELARAYADRRVTVIGLIFAKPTDKIRSFADAFRLRKDRPAGDD
jgi:hypothetical protein